MHEAPGGHALTASTGAARTTVKMGGDEWVVFAGRPWPELRCKATVQGVADLDRYQGWTPLQAGSTMQQPKVARTASGELDYQWRTGTPPADLAQLHKLGLVTDAEANASAIYDTETGLELDVAGGSVHWHEGRQSWLAIFGALAIDPSKTVSQSLLGEIWFAEAKVLPGESGGGGAWGHATYATKVATHNASGYSCYNPTQHAMFSTASRIYFSCTFVNTFSGNTRKEPLYDYNNMMFGLDLSELPVVRFNNSSTMAGALKSDDAAAAPTEHHHTSADEQQMTVMDQPQQPTTANKTVMAWIADIGSDAEYREVVAWVSENRNAFNAVSDTTLYTIAANGTLSKNLPNLHRHAVWKQQQQHGSIRTSPTIYGDTSLATMRLIWQNPEPFIQALLADAQQYEFDGIVLDWEAFGNLTDPAYPPLADDGVQYAKFLRRFSEAAHDVGVFISATADTPADECTPQSGRNHGLPCPWYVRLWNWELLAESGCRLAAMSTYTENDGAFSDHVKWASWFGSGQNIGIGVCPACLHDAHFNTSKAFLDYRFDLINQNQFGEIDVWVLGYRDWKGALAPWLQHLSAFISD